MTGPIPASACRLPTSIYFEVQFQSGPGFTCYPSCLSSYPHFKKAASLTAVCPAAAPSAAPNSAAPAAPLVVAVTLTFSGLTQSIISSDTSGTIAAALQVALAAALGITAQRAAGTDTVSTPVWTFTTTRLLRMLWEWEGQRSLLSAAQASLQVVAQASDFPGGYSNAQITAALSSSGTVIASAIAQTAVVQAAGVSVVLTGISATVFVPSTVSAQSSSPSNGTVIGAAVGAVGGGLLVAVIIYFFYFYKKEDTQKKPSADGDASKHSHAYEMTSSVADVEAEGGRVDDGGDDDVKKSPPRGSAKAVVGVTGGALVLGAAASGATSAPGSPTSPPAPPSKAEVAAADTNTELSLFSAPPGLGAWESGAAVVASTANAAAAVAAEALLPGLLSIVKQVPLLGPCAGILLQFYNVYVMMGLNGVMFASLKEQCDLAVGWIKDIAPRIKTGEIDSALVEQALQRVVAAVHHSANLITSVHSRYEKGYKKGMAKRILSTVTKIVMSSTDKNKLTAALTWLKEVIAYLLQTIPTVTGLQVNAKLDSVSDNMNAMMSMLETYSQDKTQANERGKKLGELTLQASDIKLNNVIGQGGFATVFSGSFHSKQCAIKVIKRKDGNRLNKMEREAIENELLMTRYLADPNILHCYGFIHEQDRTLVVLEFAPYGSLWELLQDDTVFPMAQDADDVEGWGGITGGGDGGGDGDSAPPQPTARLEKALPFSLSVGWIKDVSSAVAHMYGKGVKHKDIKAENLLVYAYPDRLIAKLCDFGFAKQSSATMSHAGGGTAVFEAPEVRATGKGSFASDVFSIGMTGVQILTRQSPARQDWDGQVKRAVGKHQPRGPAHEALQALLLRMVEADQIKRPNAIECSSALDDLLEALGGDPRTDPASPDYELLEAIEDRVKAAKRGKLGDQGRRTSTGGQHSGGASGATSAETNSNAKSDNNNSGSAARSETDGEGRP